MFSLACTHPPSHFSFCHNLFIQLFYPMKSTKPPLFLFQVQCPSKPVLSHIAAPTHSTACFSFLLYITSISSNLLLLHTRKSQSGSIATSLLKFAFSISLIECSVCYWRPLQILIWITGEKRIKMFIPPKYRVPPHHCIPPFKAVFARTSKTHSCSLPGDIPFVWDVNTFP